MTLTGGTSGLQGVAVGEKEAFAECQHMAYSMAYCPSSQLQERQLAGSEEWLGVRSERDASLASFTKKGELCEEPSGHQPKDCRASVSSLAFSLALAFLT